MDLRVASEKKPMDPGAGTDTAESGPQKQRSTVQFAVRRAWISALGQSVDASMVIRGRQSPKYLPAIS